MPRGIVRRAKARIVWTQAHRRQLLTGHDMFDTAFGRDDDIDTNEAFASWMELRGELLPSFIAMHPGRRPWAWWAFDASEPRRQLTPGPKCWGPANSFFGIPSKSNAPLPPGMFESELAYLERMNLLDPSEAAVLDQLKAKEAATLAKAVAFIEAQEAACAERLAARNAPKPKKTRKRRAKKSEDTA